jgi:hypothetical protein
MAYNAAELAEARANVEVNHVLDVCGISDANHVRVTLIITEGFNTLTSFGMMENNKDVKDMCARIAGRTKEDGRVIIGTVQMKCLQALVYWIKNCEKYNMELDHTMWTEEQLHIALNNKESEAMAKDIKADIIDPGKCKTGLEWDDWQIAFENKMEVTIGVGNLPLAYVIRKPMPEQTRFASKEEELMYRCPLDGTMFRKNNMLV